MTSRRSPPEDFSRDPKRQRTFHHCPDTSHEPPRNAFPRPHEKYTVAWICVLHIEMTAAEAMLDELHDTLPTHVDDNNTYPLGRIHKHNVVISCLPTGYYGTINAATVISNLKRSFPSIRAGLMVGIGGGVPSKADLRLGDVVVGTRVMQCDMGKIVENGQLQRTAIARIPHQLLCTAVFALRAKQERVGTSITSIVAQKFVGHSGYHRPNLPDDLFPPTYDHEPSNLDCKQCDRTKLVPRRQRSEPVIHYGAIASGNQVMRSALQRDIIGQDLDVICFEMEASGLMDNIPCLPIRGICDYSDSHKNKSWQRYAAAAAAAFATELLAVLPSSELRERLELPSRTEPGPPDDRWQQLLEFLNFDQKDSRQSSIKTAHAKTCRWILKHADYEAWLDPKRLIHHHGFLWIRGKPGAGKSTLMKFAYGNMRRARRRHGTTAAFFFNARGDYIERSVPGMYRSLLLQLLQGVPEVQSIVDNPEFEYKDLNECLQLDYLKELFWSAVLALGQQPFTCFIDALDECDEQQVMDMVRFFEDLARQTTEKNVKFRICFSSRHYPYIFVPESINLVLEHQQGHAEDLAAFVDSRLRIDSALRSQLQPDILQKASGVFLWVSLVVDILNDQYARGGMDLRKRLREIPEDLHDLFKDMLRRDERNKESLLLCILWILCAKRPLNPSEFSHALWSGLLMNGQADDEPPTLMRADGSSAADRFVVGSSKGLAEVAKIKEPRVQFIHESVRDFLLKSGGLRELWPDLGYDWQIQAHERLKECCSCYLGYRPVQTLASQFLDASSMTSKDNALEQYPFLDYASQHVLYHSDIADEAISQHEFLSRFPTLPWIAISNLFQKHDSRRYTANANFLYILADKGCANLIRRWLTDHPQADLFDKKERFRYPLFAAWASGSKPSVAAILNVSTTMCDGVDITEGLGCIKDLGKYLGRTPLSWASQEGRVGIVKILLRNGAMVSENDANGRTALSRASQRGQHEIVSMLIEHGAEPNAAEFEGREQIFPIFKATTGATAQLLVEKGADINLRTENGRTVLHYMVHRREHGSLRALLNTSIDLGSIINATDNFGLTPLSQNTVYKDDDDHFINSTLLIQLGADPSIGQAIHYAARCGFTKLFQLYIQHGAYINARDKDGRTPISLAFRSARLEIVSLLLNEGTDVDGSSINDYEEWSVYAREKAIEWASKNGLTSALKLFVRNGIRLNIKDVSINLAEVRGHTAIVDILKSASILKESIENS
ncbi:putative ankyrin repeat protein [Colletotrichum tropicale]|nr:putative ankyrin repeat protein [Colletotrichum tropicale]